MAVHLSDDDDGLVRTAEGDGLEGRQRSGGRRVEIAGAGIAGLGLGIMLARSGWGVRVHERDDVREVGAGIYLRNNTVKVLETLGLADEVRAHGVELDRSQWREGDGELRQDVVFGSAKRQWVCPRQVVISALERAARASGVDICVGSEVVSATRDGVLRTAAGAEHHADLVVAADGHRSGVRQSLGVSVRHQYLPTLATRFLLPDRDVEPEDKTTMYWSGHRRVGVTACSRGETYVYLITPQRDNEGRKVPIAPDAWSRSFPVLGDLFDRLAGLPAIQHNYVVVKCKPWSVDRVAVVGDAAHALPPVLGQGAGLALSNAWALARELRDADAADVPARLRAWERHVRHFADTTQAWSMRLDRMTNKWPTILLPLRSRALSFIGNTTFVQNHMRAADGFPIASGGQA